MKNRLALTLGIVLMTVITVVGLTKTACKQATSKTPATSESACNRIKIIVDDLTKQGQLSRDFTVLFLPAKDNNNAFQQAQNLCIRLGGEMTEKERNSTTYELPDGTGKFTIIDIEEDPAVYMILFLKVDCDDLKVKEIRFITLRAYADLEKSEME